VKAPLIITRLEVEDLTFGVRRLQEIAFKNHGTAIRFDDAARRPDAEGVVLFLPAGTVPAVEAEIRKLGEMRVTTQTNGTRAERISKIEESAKARVSQLEAQLDTMLLHYYREATPVQIVLEDLARIKNSLSNLRKDKSDPNYALIWVKLL